MYASFAGDVIEIVGSVLSISNPNGKRNVEDDTFADAVIASVTYDGNALLFAHKVVHDEAFNTSVEFWYLLDEDIVGGLPASGDIVVTTTGDADDILAGALMLYNVAQQAPEVTAGLVTSSVFTSVATDITTITDGSWVIDGLANGLHESILLAA